MQANGNYLLYRHASSEKALTQDVFRTALLILSGNATASLLLLVRNLVVARLIPVEDYGVAATFAVVMAMVEMASAFGLQQQIVQSKDGDDPRFQAALQGFQVLRGVVAGAVLLLIAGPMARFLGIPEVIWAYQLLALVPVIKAFEHFDIHRLNRQMRFWPMILTGGIPALLSLLLVWPLAEWLGDWRVMLYAILAQIALMAITSHLVAERPYRLVLDSAIIGGSLRFGWPILANSVLMFLVFQGDKLIVGRVLGMEALAIFAMGMTLTLTPTIVFAKSAQNFFLPQLSRLDRNTTSGHQRFQHIAMVACQTHVLFAALFVCLIAFLGPAIVHVLLGEKFSDLISILTLLAVLQGTRVLKGGQSSVALADGQTENAMIANIPRVLLLLAGYWVAVTYQSVTAIIMIAILGEVAGFVLASLLLWKRSKVGLASVIRPVSALFFLFGLMLFKHDQLITVMYLAITMLVLVFLISSMKDLRTYSFNRAA